MLVTELSGARLGLASTILVLVPLVLTSHRSPAKHHSDTIVRLLNTPAHQLDDAAIWEVASFLSNYTSLPSEDDVKALNVRIQEYIDGNGEPETHVILHGRAPVKPKKHKQKQLKLTIEKLSQGEKDDSHRVKSHKSVTRRPYPDPSGLGPEQDKNRQKKDGQTEDSGHKDKRETSSRSGQRSVRSAGDRFYFLHHLRPDLPALDRVMAEEPPEDDQESSSESSSTPPAPPRHQPPVSEDQRLQTLLRAMVVYGEAAEGDEGTLSAVKRLAEEGVARVEPPKFRKGLAKIIEDKSILKTRRRRAASRPDMARFADLMGRERYSQELINSFQPGGKRHLSIKKELREPIDVDMTGVAIMAASLRKRSAPELPSGGPGLPEQLPSGGPELPEQLPSGGEKQPSPGADVDGIGVDLGHSTGLRPDTGAGVTSNTVQQYRAATYGKPPHDILARRRRSVGGTRRVLDDIRIAPDLPDMMDLDPEDVLESEQSPLVPVLVSSGAEEPGVVTEPAALVLEDTGRRETWGEWGRWGPCSVTCGPGQKARYRHCVQGPRCRPGERETDFKPCFRKSCSLPVPDGLVDAFR